MKISALVIAHNEERYIGTCLYALTHQTQAPDEIVLVAHNCNDRTEEIARAFPHVRIVSYRGPAGSVYARIKGFEEVTGDIVLCTDGDSFPDKNWVREMAKPFADPTVSGVDGFVHLTHSFLASMSSYQTFHFLSFLRLFYPPLERGDFWGASMAFRKSAYDAIGGLTPLVAIRQRLKLHAWAEDYYLYLALRHAGGKIVLTYRTTVRTVSKLRGFAVLRRSREAQEDGRTLREYFAQKKAVRP